MGGAGHVRCDRCRSPLPGDIPDAVSKLRVQTLCIHCALGGAPDGGRAS